MTPDAKTVMDRVRRSLGHATTPVDIPPPPALPDSIVRLVAADANLAEIFSERARELKMHVTLVSAARVTSEVVAFVKDHPIQRVALADTPLLNRLDIISALNTAGVEAKRWSEITLDKLYEFDCGITEVHCAVAETAALVIKPSASHGRGLSLVPLYHIAIVEKNQILPDLIELFAKLAGDPDRSNYILISGPSKTADIEMNVVTGVHGPNVVQVFLLD